MALWMRKRDAWWQALAQESLRRKVALPKLPPVLCALSAGDPVEAREVHWLRPVEGSPGCYEGPPAGTFRLVVLSQLPRTRATLVARSMGAGETLHQALAELSALPPDSPERSVTGPAVVRLRAELKHDRSAQAREILMQTQKLYDELMQQQLQKGREQGLREALQQLCATRGLKLTATWRAKLDAETRAEVLMRWHARAVTASKAREIFSDA